MLATASIRSPDEDRQAWDGRRQSSVRMSRAGFPA
jgi:hypothetical protein